MWGVIVRTVYVWHVTWAVNSVTHLWGYRNYETGENSRNNWVVAMLTNGLILSNAVCGRRHFGGDSEASPAVA